MKKSRLLGALCACFFTLVTTTSHAQLVDRGGWLIYDTDLDVTWLADANFAQTSGFDVDGRMNWADAKTWADGLSYFDAERGVTWDDWRLPTTTQPATFMRRNIDRIRQTSNAP